MHHCKQPRRNCSLTMITGMRWGDIDMNLPCEQMCIVLQHPLDKDIPACTHKAMHSCPVAFQVNFGLAK